MSGSVWVEFYPGREGTLEVVFYCERHEEEEAIYKQALHAALGSHNSPTISLLRYTDSETAWWPYNSNTMSDHNKHQHSVTENQTRMRISTITALARAIQEQSVSQKKYQRNYNNGKIIYPQSTSNFYQLFLLI